MTKIKSLKVNLPGVDELYVVGKRTTNYSGEFVGVITHIEDHSADTQYSYINIYDIFVEGELYKSIQNTAVTVEYDGGFVG